MVHAHQRRVVCTRAMSLTAAQPSKAPRKHLKQPSCQDWQGHGRHVGAPFRPLLTLCMQSMVLELGL